ncbi:MULTISPECIES: hypothetical protein [Actinomycetes]|uniref:hypothetical protein n=1 Tax=Actinomycetes TaxID=1760 RepID=UPI001E50E6A0|nr:MULTISPECIES: hypothetical protein [Actinomycetes]MDX2377284.1 hypothetical protein [Microbacterium sp. LRZ72]
MSGAVEPGGEVSEEQLRRLMGHGQDPNTSEQLGRPYRRFASTAERVARRLEKLPETLAPADRGAQVALIEAEEAGKPTGVFGEVGEAGEVLSGLDGEVAAVDFPVFVDLKQGFGGMLADVGVFGVVGGDLWPRLREFGQGY